MQFVKTLWTLGWTVALVAGFGGLAVLGTGLMVGAFWYSTGIFWGIITFLLGLFGVLLAASFAMTARNRPEKSAA